MQPLIILFLSLVFSPIVWACEDLHFPDFKFQKEVQGVRLFENSSKTAVVGIQCQKMESKEIYQTLQLFPGRTIFDSTTSFFELKSQKNSISRIYFKVKDKKLLQVSITSKINDSAEVQYFEKQILQLFNK